MRYWQIAAGNSGRDYSTVFAEYDVELLGPSYLGNAHENPDGYKGRGNTPLKQVSNFSIQVLAGDVMIAHAGREVVNVGIVTADENKNIYSFNNEFRSIYGWDIRHTIRVKWSNTNMADELRLVYKHAAQKPAFTEVHESHIKQMIAPLIAHFPNRPLRSLPEINSSIYSDEELGSRLFYEGISKKNVDDIIGALNQAKWLLNWYDSTNQDGRPTEHEVVSHMTIPLLLGLGWSHQQIGVEYKKIDIAIFDKSPSLPENCKIIIEAKGLGQGLKDVLSQPQRYITDNNMENVEFAVVTNGATWFIYRVTAMLIDSVPIGYIDLRSLQEEYLIPTNIDLVKSLVMLKP